MVSRDEAAVFCKGLGKFICRPLIYVHHGFKDVTGFGAERRPRLPLSDHPLGGRLQADDMMRLNGGKHLRAMRGDDELRVRKRATEIAKQPFAANLDADVALLRQSR